MKPDALCFVVTYKCNIRCSHCCVESGPEVEGPVLTADAMISVVESFQGATSGLHRVSFTGGEPTLYPDEILPVIRYSSDRSMETRVVTNAAWAATAEVAARTCKLYRDFGLTEFSLSYSPYHREYVEFDRYIHSTQAAINEGIHVQILITGPEPENLQKELHLQMSARIQFEEAQISFHTGPVVPAGRAASFPNDMKAAEPGGCGMIMNPVVITPDGEIVACCGFPYKHISELRLGHIRIKESIQPALHAAVRSPLFRWIHDAGPWAILQTIHPERYNPESPKGHICQGCNVLFGDPENRERLLKYLQSRGEDILFDECLRAFQPQIETSIKP